jgi:ribosomal protein S1
VVRDNNGGLIIDVGGIRGFLPRSLMTKRQYRRYRDLVGRRWKGYIHHVQPTQVILTARKPQALAPDPPPTGRRSRTEA